MPFLNLFSRISILSAVFIFSFGSVQAAPKVAADILPVHSLVSMVMEGVGEPTFILPINASPHDYAIRPSDAKKIHDADIIFWVGEGLTPWFGKAVSAVAPDAISVPLSDHEESDAHDHHAHGAHLWLDPVEAQEWINEITKILSRYDPSNSAAYNQNAGNAIDQISSLTDEIRTALNNSTKAQYYVYHDAFSAFEARFNLSSLGAISSNEAVPPSAKRLAKIRKTVKKGGVKCIFAEPQFDTKIIQTLTEDTTVRTETLDILGSQFEPGKNQYKLMMQEIKNRVSSCLE